MRIFRIGGGWLCLMSMTNERDTEFLCGENRHSHSSGTVACIMLRLLTVPDDGVNRFLCSSRRMAWNVA